MRRPVAAGTRLWGMFQVWINTTPVLKLDHHRTYELEAGPALLYTAGGMVLKYCELGAEHVERGQRPDNVDPH